MSNKRNEIKKFADEIVFEQYFFDKLVYKNEKYHSSDGTVYLRLKIQNGLGVVSTEIVCDDTILFHDVYESLDEGTAAFKSLAEFLSMTPHIDFTMFDEEEEEEDNKDE